MGPCSARCREILCYNRTRPCGVVSHPCGSGGTGRHTILRGWRRKAWGFKSPLPHQVSNQLRVPESLLRYVKTGLGRGSPHHGAVRRGRLCLASPAVVSSSVAIGASDAHERNSVPSIGDPHDETCASATRARVIGCFVPHYIVHWQQELKPMPKDIAAPHNSACGCDRYRQFDL